MKCFKSRKPVIRPPSAGTIVRSPRGKTLFVVVGHNRSDGGANNYLGESEYTFNKRIASKLQNYLGDRDVKVFTITRPTGSYGHQVRSVKKEVKKIMAFEGITDSLGMNLHFNDAGKSARGCECLIARGADPTLADNITDLLNERLGIVERHNDGVFEIPEKHNGGTMVYMMESIGVNSPIVEPVFAGYRTKESESVFSNEDRYVSILGDAVLMTLD